MSDETKSDPIGGPEPIHQHEGLRILKRVATIASVSVGGMLAFAFLLTPTRLQGATRSARLRWQQRQNDIQQAITSGSAETNMPAAADVVPNPSSDKSDK
jgi:hypothetical protein